MSYNFTVYGHVGAAAGNLNTEIKAAADTFVQSLRDAGVPIEKAVLMLPDPDGGTTDYTADQTTASAEATPTPTPAGENPAGGEPQPTGAE